MKYPFIKAIADGSEFWVVRHDPMKGDICLTFRDGRIGDEGELPIQVAYKWASNVVEFSGLESINETKKRGSRRRGIISYLKKKGTKVAS